MARVNYFRAFDISRQFYFGDWTNAALTATATGLTLNLAGARIVLGGSFTLAGSTPTAGTITSLTYSTIAGVPVNEFSVTGLSMSYGGFLGAMADNDFNAVVGNGADWVSGTTANDRLYGSTGNDRLEGMAGNDSLFGGVGNDTLDGGAGNDSMQGGSGNDIYAVDSTLDRVFESAGGGVDGVRTSLPTYALAVEVENLQATGVSNFTGSGNGLNNLIVGGRGNDRLSGLDGNDTLRGGNGHDTLDGGNGDDFILGDAGLNPLAASVSGVSPSQANVPITLSMALNDAVATTSTTVTGYIGNTALNAGPFNLAFAVSVSSTIDSRIAGSHVDDFNGNRVFGEKIDAIVGSFNALVASLRAAGLGDQVRIGLIPFGWETQIKAVGTPNSDADGNGTPDIVEAASTLSDQYGTDYVAGLGKSIEFFNGSPRGNNFLFVLSDQDSSDQTAYAAQLNTLRNAAGINANIRAMQTFDWEFASFSDTLDMVDNGVLDGSNLRVRSPAELTASLLGSRVNTGDIARLEIYKNGVLVSTLSPSQLVNTPFGLRYSATVSGLSSTGSDDIEARLILNGSAVHLSTSQRISAGTLASNDSLVGGGGNDNLDGGAGIDTLAGGTGNDTYHVASNVVVIQELAGQGTDTIETTLNYSLNTPALQYIENLKLLDSRNINGTGNANANLITGNSGNNVLEGLGGNDTLVGGFGFDIASYANSTYSVTVHLGLGTASARGKADQLVGIRGVWGSAFGDSLTGGAADETFRDSLTGGAADETFRGNGGDDSISGGYGFDTLDYSAATAGMTVIFPNHYIIYPANYGTATCADGSQGSDSFNILDIEGIIGSAFNDNISDADRVNNKFQGGAGNDTLSGGGGDDTLIGGTGNDILQGGDGFDTADYFDATAAVSGSILTGRIAVGTSGRDVDSLSNIEQLRLSRYADSVAGGTGDDALLGGTGNDTLSGNAGNDTLDGGSGDDSLAGGAGDDIYYVDSLRDVITENSAGGTDTVVCNIAGGSPGLRFAEVENISFSGNASYNVFGGSVLNNIFGGYGNDTINGGSGRESDTLNGGAGDNWVSYADHIAGVSGNMGLYGVGSIDGDTLIGFNNFLGSAFDDSVSGSNSNGILSGGAGNDTLDGSDGNDTLIGGAGNDSLIGGYGSDTVSYAHLSPGVTVNISTGVATTTSEGTDTLSGVETIIGGSGNDVIVWGSVAHVDYVAPQLLLQGGAGNDTLTGFGNSDTLVGGSGNDVLNGGNAERYYDNEDYADYSTATGGVIVNIALGTASGAAGNDRLINIEGVIGSNYADQIVGSSLEGENIIGGGGADILDGGLDDCYDMFIYHGVSDSTASGMDVIRNFRSTGLYQDKISLSAIDANTIDSNDSGDFGFIGINAFSRVAGQLRYVNSGGDTFVYGDVDGNGVADLTIKLLGTHTLTSTHFLL